MSFSVFCGNCDLCKNQAPSFYEPVKSDVMFVGISSQKNKDKELMPFDFSTNSGKVIREIERRSGNFKIHKTNLLKCVPMRNGEVVYPNSQEYENCFGNFERELKIVSPCVVFLFGSPVWKFVEKKYGVRLKINVPFDIGGVKFVKVYHPSYVLIYRRKYLEEYMGVISNIIVEV